MEKAELLAYANRFYADGSLSAYHDEDGEFVDAPNGGDGLARFIVSELTESIDFGQPDIFVMREARKAMHRAMDDICSVLAGLDKLKCWRGEKADVPECRACHCLEGQEVMVCSLGLRWWNCNSFALCQNCRLDDELTVKGQLLGSNELVYQCIDEREVNGLLDKPCTKGEGRACFVDPRELY